MKRQSPNSPLYLRRSSDAGRRPGFTLVELLVVISLIAVMAALSIRVIVGFVTLGRESATKTTIQKIQRILDSRMQAFQRKFGNNDAATKSRLKNTTEWQLSSNLRVLDTNNNQKILTEDQRIVATRKLLYIKYFPQSCWEVDVAMQPRVALERIRLNNKFPSWDLETTVTLQESILKEDMPDARRSIDNAEVLYDLVVNAAALGDLPIGTDAFLTSEFADLDGDGYPEFIDAWRRPIRFYRWPVMLFRTDGNGNGDFFDEPPTTVYADLLINSLRVPVGFANQLAWDPQDPLGELSFVVDVVKGGPPIARNPAVYAANRRVAPAGFNLPGTFHTPLIVSAGADGEFGIREPVYGTSIDPNTFGYLGQLEADPNVLDSYDPRLDWLADNICSLNIRAGGN